MKQPGYLFTAGVTVSQVRPGARGEKSLQTSDSCTTAIVYGSDAGRARKTFEDWCQAPRQGDEPAETEIKKIVGAELIDQLLTESASEPLDWPAISQRLMESVEPVSTPKTEGEAPPVPEDRGEGYWVDVNQVVPPESARLSVELLKGTLPEEIGSALNWSPDKKFLFLVSNLSPPSVAPEASEEIQETDSDAMEEEEGGDSGPMLEQWVTSLPEMREKKAAALVEARNSVVAGWLWRRWAATTPLAPNEILVNPCCAIMPET